MSDYSETALAALRSALRGGMSQKRFLHTLGVEQTVAEMAYYHAPQSEDMLRAAALLHDLTKEYGDAETKAILLREGITLREDELASPQIWHAITAPAEICRHYPAFANEALLSAVRWHTTGHAGMTVEQALLYLADVIEPGRTYPACVQLRERFFSAPLASMSHEARAAHLRDVLLESLGSVCDSLTARGLPVCRDTLEAVQDLKLRKTL